MFGHQVFYVDRRRHCFCSLTPENTNVDTWMFPPQEVKNNEGRNA
uniref:Uncharacterized protein n=1 Tax=Lepeophtheirus salmonis TaxID=72036 RepID=A0A0K2TH34_LEPSM